MPYVLFCLSRLICKPLSLWHYYLGRILYILLTTLCILLLPGDDELEFTARGLSRRHLAARGACRLLYDIARHER